MAACFTYYLVSYDEHIPGRGWGNHPEMCPETTLTEAFLLARKESSGRGCLKQGN